MSMASMDSESFSLFVDKICELAEIHGLPSDDYRSILSSASLDVIKKQSDKVCTQFNTVPNNIK